MSALSVAHRVALTALIEQVSDAALVKLSSAAAALPGERSLELGAMLADEVLDRKRRRLVLAPVLPMFRPRADGIQAMTFPPAVLPRLWKAGSTREPALLPRLDKEGPDAVAVCDRILLCQI